MSFTVPPSVRPGQSVHVPVPASDNRKGSPELQARLQKLRAASPRKLKAPPPTTTPSSSPLLLFTKKTPPASPARPSNAEPVAYASVPGEAPDDAARERGPAALRRAATKTGPEHSPGRRANRRPPRSRPPCPTPTSKVKASTTSAPRPIRSIRTRRPTTSGRSRAGASRSSPSVPHSLAGARLLVITALLGRAPNSPGGPVTRRRYAHHRWSHRDHRLDWHLHSVRRLRDADRHGRQAVTSARGGRGRTRMRSSSPAAAPS